MVTIRNTAVLLLVLLPRSAPAGSGFDRGATVSTSLFAQSAAQSLERDFPNPDLSFLLVDATTGQLLAARWDHAERPIPMGSLAKPFAAIAYGEKHNYRYPNHICRGTASGCWRPAGHGMVNLTSAIAYSCNSYFRSLTTGLHPSDVLEVTTRFGLDAPSRDAPGAALAGLEPGWLISPLHMAQAYVELLHQKRNPAVAQILSGMSQSARRGTGAAVDHALFPSRALVKTGTAPCTHARHAPGDGFTVALVPADDPKVLLLICVHGVPGAEAAKTAGRMLRAIGS